MPCVLCSVSHLQFTLDGVRAWYNTSLQRDHILQSVAIFHEMADQLILRLRIDIIAGDGFGNQTDQLQLADAVVLLD